MRPLVRSYGVISTSTSSPVRTRMRFLRIFPAVWPRTSWPFSRRTRNIALGSSSTTCPRISSNSSLAKRFLSQKRKKSRSLSGRAGKCEGIRSDRENGGSASLAAFEGAVGVGCILEREALLDLDLHLAGGDHVKQGPRRLLQVGRIERVIVERRPGQEQRSFAREKQPVERVDRTGSVAETRHHAAPVEAI